MRDKGLVKRLSFLLSLPERIVRALAAILGGGERTGRITISQQTMRHLLDSIATRLDEARDISR